MAKRKFCLVSEETHRRLVKYQGKLQYDTGKQVSMDEVINTTLDRLESLEAQSKGLEKKARPFDHALGHGY